MDKEDRGRKVDRMETWRRKNRQERCQDGNMDEEGRDRKAVRIELWKRKTEREKFSGWMETRMRKTEAGKIAGRKHG